MTDTTELEWTLEDIETIWFVCRSRERDPKRAYALAERLVPEWGDLVHVYRMLKTESPYEAVYATTRHVKERMKQNADR